MSDTIGTSAGGHPAPGMDVVHEAYAFACMGCGHLWEQSFDIEHHVDAQGRTVCQYRAEGRHVPSPLTRPTCSRCGGHLVRIMQAGAVNNPLLQRPYTTAGSTPAAASHPGGHHENHDENRDQDGDGGHTGASGEAPEPHRHGHHWHLWHLPAFLHRKSDPAA
jgi:hypothetical protein